MGSVNVSHSTAIPAIQCQTFVLCNISAVHIPLLSLTGTPFFEMYQFTLNMSITQKFFKLSAIQWVVVNATATTAMKCISTDNFSVRSKIT